MALLVGFWLPYPHLGHDSLAAYGSLMNFFILREHTFIELVYLGGFAALIAAYFKPGRLSAIIGLAVCSIELNTVYLWTSSAPVPPAFNLIYVTNITVDELTIGLASLVMVIAAVAARKEYPEKIPLWIVEFGALAVFPLGVDIALFSYGSLNVHVIGWAMNWFAWITNADLLYLGPLLFFTALVAEVALQQMRRSSRRSPWQQSVMTPLR